MCSSRKYPYPPQGRLTKIPRGRGVSKAQLLKGKYGTKMEFPEERGWGVKLKKPSVGGVWIFSGTTQFLTSWYLQIPK